MIEAEWQTEQMNASQFSHYTVTAPVMRGPSATLDLFIYTV